MDYLRLALALLLPWLAGFAWLRVLETKADPASGGNTLRQIGFGFYLGYAGLFALLYAFQAMPPDLAFWITLGALALITGAGIRLCLRDARLPAIGTGPSQDAAISGTAARGLLVLLLAAIGVHLLLVAIEVLYRPVFPWDGWTNWIYRAKAWFTNAETLRFISPQAWPDAGPGRAFNVPGYDYPTFLPRITTWFASALGYWSDTLVNLGNLCGALALALGIYGLCREAGGSRPLAALGSYLLLSLPIVGAHQALPGMADIWMSGFNGLGFAALLAGLCRPDQRRILLGLLMIALGLLVKREGLLWLPLAAILLLTCRYPRPLAVAFALAAAAAVAAWFSGITFIDLGPLGQFGYQQGSLLLPGIGSVPLMQFDIASLFFRYFVLHASWHLLWPVLVLTIGALALQPGSHQRLVLLSFYGLFILCLAVMFGLTDQGRWAADGTAINRLPLQFAPALVFGVVLTLLALPRHRTADQQPDRAPARRRHLWLAPIIGLGLVAAGICTWLAVQLPDNAGPARHYQPRDMQLVIGSGYAGPNHTVINQFDRRIALLSSGPISLDAASVGLLRVATGGSSQRPVGFFWRRGTRSDVQRLDMPGVGRHLIALDNHGEWRDQVTEVGLIFYQDEGRSTEFHSLALEPRTLGASLQILWAGWTSPAKWSQASVNSIADGNAWPGLPLAPVALAWLLLAALVSWLYSRNPGVAARTLLACALLAWAMLDLRWTSGLASQARATLAARPLPGEPPHNGMAGDRIIARFLHQHRHQFQGSRSGVLLVAARPDMDYQLLRAKYHLLPQSSYAHRGSMNSLPTRSVDHVLMLNPLLLEPGQERVPARVIASQLAASLGREYRVAVDDSVATLLRAVDFEPPPE